MIPCEFEYHRPAKAEQAADLYQALRQRNISPVYYGGGTEILTESRLGRMQPGAVIDIKSIPECLVHEYQGDELVLGAGLTLADVCERRLWPLLSAAAGRIADHTTRCKITLGGNIAGTIPYREAVLPFLLADADAVIVGSGGRRHVPLFEVFDAELRLTQGEFLAQLRVDRSFIDVPFVSTKRTRLDWVDYPLLTACAMKPDRGMRLAISGLTSEPFRSNAMEQILSNTGVSAKKRVERALCEIPGEVVNDLHGSADFRRFILAQTLTDILTKLEG